MLWDDSFLTSKFFQGGEATESWVIDWDFILVERAVFNEELGQVYEVLAEVKLKVSHGGLVGIFSFEDEGFELALRIHQVTLHLNFLQQ